MNNKIFKISLIAFITLLLVTGIAFSYAYFTMNIVQNQKLTVLNSGDLKLRYTDNTELSLENALPGDSIVKTFTVENIGSKKVSYNIIWNNLINTINNYDLQLDMKCKSYKDYNTSSKTESGECKSFYKAVPYTETSISKDIKRNNEIDAGITHEYTVTITFKNRPYLQNDNLNKSFSGKIDLEEYVDPSPEAIYCTYDGNLTQGTEYVNGQYTYRYMQEGSYDENTGNIIWQNISSDGWGVQLTDKTSTDAVTSEVCTYINNNPVVSMSYMFANSQATSIDLSSFDTGDVTNMSYMFYSISASSINLSSFNTGNVTNMEGMFSGSSSSIEALDLSSFDTSKVTNMYSMFQNSFVTTLDVSNFDTSNVTSMGSMFSDSGSIEALDLSSFDTSKVTDMSEMFALCGAMIIELSNFDTSNVTRMGGMFFKSQVTTLDLSTFDTSKITNMSHMFFDSQATSIDVSNFDTSKVIDMSYMFSGCKASKIDGLKNFDTSKVTNMDSMFSHSQVTTLDVSNFNTSNVTNMSYMFSSIQAAILDVSNFNTSNVTDMRYMFSNSQATILDVSNFDTSKVTDMSYMFNSATNLKTIYASDKFNTNNVTSSTNMFINSTNLVGGAGTKYDSTKIDKTYARIDGGTSNPG